MKKNSVCIVIVAITLLLQVPAVLAQNKPSGWGVVGFDQEGNPVWDICHDQVQYASAEVEISLCRCPANDVQEACKHDVTKSVPSQKVLALSLESFQSAEVGFIHQHSSRIFVITPDPEKASLLPGLKITLIDRYRSEDAARSHDQEHRKKPQLVIKMRDVIDIASYDPVMPNTIHAKSPFSVKYELDIIKGVEEDSVVSSLINTSELSVKYKASKNQYSLQRLNTWEQRFNRASQAYTPIDLGLQDELRQVVAHYISEKNQGNSQLSIHNVLGSLGVQAVLYRDRYEKKQRVQDVDGQAHEDAMVTYQLDRWSVAGVSRQESGVLQPSFMELSYKGDLMQNIAPWYLLQDLEQKTRIWSGGQVRACSAPIKTLDFAHAVYEH